MNIYVFSDESGIFDYKHHELFVYAGVVVIGKQEMDMLSRKFLALEKKLRQKTKYRNMPELKAKYLDEKDRKKLLGVFCETYKFAIAIKLNHLDLKRVFHNQKSKQNYMDFAYRFVLRKAFEHMIGRGSLFPDEAFDLIINEDNHHIVECDLQQKADTIYKEFKEGTFRTTFGVLFPPLFENLGKVEITLRDSVNSALIRGADIVANTVYTSILKNELEVLENDDFYIEFLP